MLKTLDKEQEKLMIIVRDEWIHRLDDCKPTNQKQAIKYINWLYELAGFKKPFIIFLDSPLGLQLGANMLKQKKENSVRNSVWNSVWSSVWNSVRNSVENSVWSSVWNSVRNSVRNSVENSVWNSVENSVWSSVRSSVRNSVENSVWSSVRSSVWNSVRNSVENSKLEYFSLNWYYTGGIVDYGWAAFYDYFIRIGIIDYEPFNNFLFLLKANIYDMLFFDGLCLVSNMPSVLKRDAQGRLHNEHAPAIEFRDGYKLFFYHGIEVTPEWILHPKKLTKDDWSNEVNLEKRRVIQELMGHDFPKKLKAKLISKPSKEFRRHNLLGLYEIELPRDPEKIARYIKVQDHSSKRQYFLRVKPTINNADEALAFTYGMSRDEYNPIQEA